MTGFATLTVEQAALYQKTLTEMMQRLITLESKAKEEGIDAKAIRTGSCTKAHHLIKAKFAIHRLST